VFVALGLWGWGFIDRFYVFFSQLNSHAALRGYVLLFRTLLQRGYVWLAVIAVSTSYSGKYLTPLYGPCSGVFIMPG